MQHQRAHAFLPSQCRTWIDTGLAAGACSPKQLLATVAAHTFDKPGTFTILVAGRHTGTAPGVVQVVGGAGKLGMSFRFVGKPAPDEIIVLNCLVGRRLYAVILTSISMRIGASAILVVKNGAPSAKLSRITAKQAVRTY